jgi:hypothetical protein
MTFKFAAMAIATTVMLASVGHIAPAEAKGKTFWVPKKAGTYKNMPKPYVKGHYMMTCMSWGDCVNWKIASK